MRIGRENSNLIESENNIPAALRQTSVDFCSSKQQEIFCILTTAHRKTMVSFPYQHSTVFYC